jgi:uncharacterized protein YwgA
MAALRDVMAYVCAKYPGSDLSKAKLAKILYLADWKSALEGRPQITPIIWKFNHYGPYVTDVVDVARQDHDFVLSADWTQFGNRRTIVQYKGSGAPELEKSDQDILDEIIRRVSNLSFDAFLKLVYSTYPVVVSDRGSTLDLTKLAAEYQRSGLSATKPLAGVAR